MSNEKTIELIKGRIMDEYRKHPDLDWAEIAARKIYSQWLVAVFCQTAVMCWAVYQH